MLVLPSRGAHDAQRPLRRQSTLARAKRSARRRREAGSKVRPIAWTLQLHQIEIVSVFCAFNVNGCRVPCRIRLGHRQGCTQGAALPDGDVIGQGIVNLWMLFTVLGLFVLASCSETDLWPIHHRQSPSRRRQQITKGEIVDTQAVNIH